MEMEMLRMRWVIYTILLLELLVATTACPSDTCAIINSTEIPLATQVINMLKNRQQNNDSFTFYIWPGEYKSTNGTRSNFYGFTNITFQKDPNSSDDKEVIIQCPYLSDDGDFNSLGFVNCIDISIIGLTFTGCGTKSFGSFFGNVNNLYVVNSFFRHNLNNGLGIRSGTNVSIINCTFENSVGLQDDSTGFLIQQSSDTYGGSGLGISLQDTTNTSITVENCTFKNNIALKKISDGGNDSRPYNYIPFGNGGGIYINLNNVSRVTIRITNCSFYNNTALHQGGGIVTFVTASSDNVVEIVNSTFIGNKAIGYPLSNQTGRPIPDIDSIDSIDSFVAKINNKFNARTFNVSIRDALSGVPSETLQQKGGFGGAIAVNFFRESERNKIFVNGSTFKENLALGSAGIGIRMWVGLSRVSSGVNSNRAWISCSHFIDNHALLGGSAIGLLSRARIDVANLPTIIENCQFKENINEGDLRSSLFRFGANGVIITIRSPLTFLGANQFNSNVGGCININNAKVDMNGTMNFTNNTKTPLGGAIRIVGLSLVQLFPTTNMMFKDNCALMLGGAIGVDNIRVEEDLARILNFNCFLQYNVGKQDEFFPSKWEGSVSFDNNMAPQGYTMYAEDISRCTSTPCCHNNSNSTVYEMSFFNLPGVFESSRVNDTRDFVTAPSKLLVDKRNKTVNVFPGEEFILSLRVLDQNNNRKVGFYTYPSNTLFTEADVTEIDLTTGNSDTSFGIVSKNNSDQRTSLVVRNSTKNFSFSVSKGNSTITEKKFTLNLIDSSTGTMISEVNVTAKLRSCHFLYVYNSSRGNCQFIRNQNKQILRGDNISTYFYIQPEMYGELENDTLRTARIPPFYQMCNREGGLPGCLVKYNDHKQQCSEGKSGFLCGECPHGSGNEVQGLAFNLLECVSCETSDRILFVFICIFIVTVSMLTMYYNIGLPNSLRGFLFYSQMIGYVYVSGARRGTLELDFFLSRVFGYSFYFPICLTHMKALQVALFGFLLPALILMTVITYTILARRITRLSNKKTLDGFWLLIFIIYVYTFDTCFNLLRCTASTVHHNDHSEFDSLVYYYDGSVPCFRDEHIIYAVISILIFLIFVLPFPFVVVAISYGYFKKAGPFCDVINTKIKPEFRWWSGYDLFRRLLFVATYFIVEIINQADYTQFLLTICAVLILLITSRVHPYNKWTVNLIECLMLLDLVLIAAYFVNNNQSVTGSRFARFLFVLPYIYMIIYVVTKCIRKTKLVNKCRRTKLFKTLKRQANIFTFSIGNTQNGIPLHENDLTEAIEESTYIREPLVYND